MTRRDVGRRVLRHLVVTPIAACGFFVAAFAEARLCGDADGDARITVTDGVDVLRAAGGLPSVCSGAACDVDGSGTATVTDGVAVLRMAASLPPPPGACEDDACEFVDEIIDDNLEVPAGFDCVLDGTRVEGNVSVGDDASLFAVESSVGGNVQAQRAFFVEIIDSEVEGDVQVEDSGDVILEGSFIDGDVQLQDNAGDLVVDTNDIGGNLQLQGNFSFDPILVLDNFIEGNLECEDNDPRPDGGGNFVEGDRDGQCDDL
jgi:hypothetical protein